jgi:hypothetical protein
VKSFKSAFARKGPDAMTEELVAVLSGKESFEFKPLFDLVYANLRARKASGSSEEMLRLRIYEKLQHLVAQGAVKKTIAKETKKYRGSFSGIGPAGCSGPCVDAKRAFKDSIRVRHEQTAQRHGRKALPE